jgi:hypothetical protein
MALTGIWDVAPFFDLVYTVLEEPAVSFKNYFKNIRKISDISFWIWIGPKVLRVPS